MAPEQWNTGPSADWWRHLPVLPPSGAQRILLACVSVGIGVGVAGFITVLGAVLGGLGGFVSGILVGLAVGAICMGLFAVVVDLGWTYALLSGLALLLIGLLGVSTSFNTPGGLAGLLGAMLFSAMALVILTDRPMTPLRVVAVVCAAVLALGSILGPLILDKQA